jgi:hypothetical protein
MKETYRCWKVSLIRHRRIHFYHPFINLLVSVTSVRCPSPLTGQDRRFSLPRRRQNVQLAKINRFFTSHLIRGGGAAVFGRYKLWISPRIPTYLAYWNLIGRRMTASPPVLSPSRILPTPCHSPFHSLHENCGARFESLIVSAVFTFLKSA